MKLTVVLAIGAAASALACWMDLPLEQVIRQSHVVVIGQITGITVADPPKTNDQYQFDVADIIVQEVLLNSLTNQTIRPKQQIPLSMPSSNNELRMSTDIRYEVGKRGIWILEFRDKTFWATYPKDYQPMSSEKEVREIVKKLKEESSNQAPHGTAGGRADASPGSP